MSGVVERQSVVSLLPNIATRTLILSGEEDVVRPPEWGREVAAGLPNAQLVMLKGVGHSPILEVPDVVIPQMLRFMAAVD
jgi:3-oxoadipate enol-lactonase